MVNLPPSAGCKQSGMRPVVVVQNNTGNHFAPTTTVVPGTSATKKNLPTHVRFSANPRIGISLDSTFMAEQVTTIDKSMIVERLGRLSDAELAEISLALKNEDRVARLYEYEEIYKRPEDEVMFYENLIAGDHGFCLRKDFGEYGYCRDGYNKYWRAWSDEPTSEQMEAVTWIEE